jgi:hypothetical protein
VQFYGVTVDTVVDGNIFESVRKGSAEYPFESVVNGYLGLTPNYFNSFLNNTYTNCRSSMFRSTEVENGGYTKYPSILGAVYRNNTVEGSVFAAIDYTPKYYVNYPVADTTAWDSNLFTNDTSIFVEGGAAGYQNDLFVGNTNNGAPWSGY